VVSLGGERIDRVMHDNHWAHTRLNKSTGESEPHLLVEHLHEVARLAEAFAAGFGAPWARLAGLWHDLGKFRPGFQRYIRQCAADNSEDAHVEGKVSGPEKTHSAAGALHAMEVFQRLDARHGRTLARVLAYLIAGHHAGLADWQNEENRDLSFRLASAEAQREYRDALQQLPAGCLPEPAALPSLGDVPGGAKGFALWVRLLFSCLVDADFLDTERFMSEGRSQAREGFAGINELQAALDEFMSNKATALQRAGLADTKVNRLRADVLRQCREAAQLLPGFFTLEVPTGGGKTLSSLAFALTHAAQHQRRRVIYAIPYTSIIEQTADVFREVFAALGEVVVEHHSQADSDVREETARSRLACENWDAPLLVTTNVQLFESLFAARTSRCRKLHNLVGSVIVLDEAQQLPREFLNPILDVLNLLVAHYGVSVVFCTATQPALTSTQYFDPSANLRGVQNARPIISSPDALFTELQRVNVRLPADFNTATPWSDLAAELAQRDCVLAIVGTRREAHDLHRLMPPGTVHLSNRMCGQHKAQVIQRIKATLKARRDGADGEPLRVVSTSLVEAGVDLDFPVVYRALAGLDSIAQAAGRCNREGLLDGLGEVVVFVPPKARLPKAMIDAASACVSALHGIDRDGGDPLNRARFEPYFRQYYRAAALDQHGIAEMLKPDGHSLAVRFRTAAERFSLIDDADQTCVIVRYRRASSDEDIDKHLATLAKHGPERWLMRALQRYTVNIHQREADRLLASGAIELILPGLHVLRADSLYHPELGLLQENRDVFNAEGHVT
jgi:CRISPR-associated endonuclease/helicase Cas3